ncbi:spore germination protein [Jeotgalibacillus marinus]|uniref:Spore germination protein n=2 Tax=Jeotgalibacillus marinus TaxID=86667 RepID=A0ABV3Q5L8_9BACL
MPSFETIKSFLPEMYIYGIALITLFVPLVISKLYYLSIKDPSKQSDWVDETSSFLSYDFEENVSLVKEELGDSSDMVLRTFQLGDENLKTALIFLKDIVDIEMINNNILQPLMTDSPYNDLQDYMDQIKNGLLPVSEMYETDCVKTISINMLQGNAVLLFQGTDHAFILKTPKSKTRSLEEPVTETLVRGPRLGFNEDIGENIALLRKAGVNTDLRLISSQVGSRFNKEVVISFVEGIADPTLVESVKRKIQNIMIDNVPESGIIEQLIEDQPLSFFPQVQNTERPDKVIAAMAEGRVAILLDGTPFALIVPVTLSMFLQSPEDYYHRSISATLNRWLRYIAAFLTVFSTPLYIAFVSFHQGLLPTQLAMSIIGAREGMPFSIIIEALIMEVAIEILREAGLRLPKPIGQAVGIVGGLVIGEAAVEAGIVSPATVIVVALSAIASFSLPQYSMSTSLRMIRFLAMFLSASFGLFGVLVFFLFFCIHLVKLNSFNTPYLSPAIPYSTSDWKDLLVRMPIKMMNKRPKFLRPKNSIRKQ